MWNAELPVSEHDIIIVHAASLIRIGLRSTINNAPAFDSYRVSAFTTFWEAETEILKAVEGDVIILDVDSWSSLTSPPNSGAFQCIKAHGPSVAIIAPIRQAPNGRLKTRPPAGSIALEAELDEILFTIEDLTTSCKQPNLDYKLTRLSLLTRRQFHILELVADGFSNKQIAFQLGVSEASVKYQVTRIFKKLGCQQRTQAAVVFVESCSAAAFNEQAVARL